MSKPSKNGGSTLTLALLMISCVMIAFISISSVGSVMISNAEPAPDSSSLESQLGYSIEESEPEPEPEPSEESEPESFPVETMDEQGSTFNVEPEEEVEQQTFKLIRNVDYWGGDSYHYSPDSNIPFTEKRCFHECSVDPTCKAVVFNRLMDRCWGKVMEDFELPLHTPTIGKRAYVKKDLYEDAIEKYG
jgi:hypothetical protein